MPLVSLEDIQEAARGLEGAAERTPLVHSDALSERAGVRVYLKCENVHPSGAFKLRGAWTFIRRLGEEAVTRGVVTYSSGNHGQAVAWAANKVGARAVIVVPETTPAIKVEGVKRWNGAVEIAGTTSEDRYARAIELAEEQGLVVVPPFDHHDIIAGQGTVGLEIVEDLPDVAHVVVPVGGGGLLAGVTTAVKAMRPQTALTAVEPEMAAKLSAALEAGEPVRLESTSSIADGLLPLSIGTVTFSHVKGRVEAVQVSDADIAEATVWLHMHEKVPAEPSGAATTAALRSGQLMLSGPCVLVVSGGNVAPERVEELATTFRIQ
ncbi:MAG: threonine/serine dehydratase [Gemmatimonadales bacterium]